MIPRAHITHWAAGAPWPSELQIEQDLVLSRLIVEIANHELLGPELAFRGGTCLHKLHLPTALRYSEDLDYVRTTQGPVGTIVDAIREITTAIGLAEHARKIRAGMATYICRSPAETGGTIRIKIETNVEATEPFLDRVELPYAVASPWFEASARVVTFDLDEMMATKLRALYQRRKGRDLYDLWHVLFAREVDDARIVAGLEHYMRAATFTFPQLAQNLKAKLDDADFASDLEPLVSTPADDYALPAAADLVMERLGARLRNAPPMETISGGSWRA